MGDTQNYVEPFFGSGAVLLNRPHAPQIETINDADSFITNVWRALQAAPDEVAFWCDWPVHEADLHARHTWLLAQRETFTARLMGDPDYYDTKIAGWWLWGICCWIGSGWCSGDGPWQSSNGQLVHLRNAGQGVHRKRVHLGNAGQGMSGQEVHPNGLLAWFAALQARLRGVRVCSGDWTRVLGPSVTWTHGLTGVVMDPPYSMEEDRDECLYRIDDGQIAHAVRAWCLDNGDNALLRIVLCGYGEVHDELLSHGWRKTTWKANGGMGNHGNTRGRANASRETLWFSPHCLNLDAEQQLALF